MAMVYDLPTVDSTAQPMQQFAAPEVKNVAPEQIAQTGAATMKAAQAVDLYMDRINDAAVKAADNKLNDGYRVALYDPKEGYMGKVGADAVKLHGDITTKLKDHAKSIEDTLENDTQRAMFKRVANARLNTAQTQVDSHAMQQTKVNDIGETTARMESNMATMVATADAANGTTYNEAAAKQYNESKSIMEQEAKDLAIKSGLGPAKAEEFILNKQTEAHTAVIQGLLEKDDPRMAQQYYDQAKEAGEISPLAHKHIEPAIKATLTRVDGFAAGDELFDAEMKRLGGNVDLMPQETTMLESIRNSGKSIKEQEYMEARMKDRIRLEIGQRHKNNTEFGGTIDQALNEDPDRKFYAQTRAMIDRAKDNPSGRVVTSDALHNAYMLVESYYKVNTEDSEDKIAAKALAYQKYVDFQDSLKRGDLGNITSKDVMKRYISELGPYTVDAMRFVENYRDVLKNPEIQVGKLDSILRELGTQDAFKNIVPDPGKKEDKAKMAFLQDSIIDQLAKDGAKGPHKNPLTLEQAVANSLRKVSLVDDRNWFTRWWTSNDAIEAYATGMLPVDKKEILVTRLLNEKGLDSKDVANRSYAMDTLNGFIAKMPKRTPIK